MNQSNSQESVGDKFVAIEAGATDQATPPSASRHRLGASVMLFVPPALLLISGILLFAGLGVAQKLGFVSGGGGGPTSSSDANTQYICPMMCTPPQSEPGRCPVCAMELVPATSNSGDKDPLAVHIDPAARRIANIQTVAVRTISATHTIRTVGELCYDEGSLQTLSAYVDGRLDRLHADFTGVKVTKGDELALVYSPNLYSAQVEYLLAKGAAARGRTSTLSAVVDTNKAIYESSRQRLIELGMTEGQITEIDRTGIAGSRIKLVAPISGTVIEKMANEGDYVKEGKPIYKLADLSSVWLMLKLFPEDAASIHYGQKLTAEVQSRPGEQFTGRVAFIDPHVDPQTRTVNVRVVIDNQHGELRIGDYARATIEAPVRNTAHAEQVCYDPELAGKYISPRHPHIIRDQPGDCPICGIELVATSDLGFSAEPIERKSLIVPRNAVLMAGGNSVVYVETIPGRFEIRRVALGPASGDDIVIHSGLSDGEQVATKGNFLIDSQMQLAGNPSLIDPTKATPTVDLQSSPEMIAALKGLSPNDRRLAEQQQICPVTKMLLGSMGTPLKVDVAGRAIFICCKGCETRLKNDSQTYIAVLEAHAQTPKPNAKVAAALSKLSPADRSIAEQQRFCPVADFELGAMGTPIKVDVNGKPVFICCDGCRERLLAKSEFYLAKLAEGVKGQSTSSVPPIGEMTPMDDSPSIPPILPMKMIGDAAEDITTKNQSGKKPDTEVVR